MALIAVMTLCLMVYAALKYRIRQGLGEQRQAFPDQKGKPGERPSACWVFQFFVGIQVALLVGQTAEVVLNLNAHHQAWLAILGEHYVDLCANSGRGVACRLLSYFRRQKQRDAPHQPTPNNASILGSGTDDGGGSPSMKSTP